jgi:hypothetical protein
MKLFDLFIQFVRFFLSRLFVFSFFNAFDFISTNISITLYTMSQKTLQKQKTKKTNKRKKAEEIISSFLILNLIFLPIE